MKMSTARIGTTHGKIRFARLSALLAGGFILLLLGMNHVLDDENLVQQDPKAGSSSGMTRDATLPFFRFTRTTLANTESDEKKDHVVSSEFGRNYRAATLLDVLAYSKRVYFSEVPAFCVAHSKHRWYANAPSDTGNPIQFTRTDEPADLPIAAIHVGAPFQFTRQAAEADSTDAAKDRIVASELGHGFQAATLLDLLGHMENNVALFESDFVVAGSRFSWRGNNPLATGGPVIIANSGKLSAPVAAIASMAQGSK